MVHRRRCHPTGHISSGTRNPAQGRNTDSKRGHVISNRMKIPFGLFMTFAFLSASAFTQPHRGARVEYKLSVSRPVSHIYDVEMEILGIRSGTVDVAMPAWAPGDYRIRDFARNVQEFSAESAKNAKLVWKQIDKQTWRINKPPEDDVHI